MEALFQRAVASHGAEYLAAESELRKATPESLPVLRANTAHSDPIVRLFAAFMLDWIEGRATEYQQALDFLDGLPKRLAKTPVTTPPATAVAADLAEQFGSRIVRLIAVRLVKETNAPEWRVLTYIFYLESQRVPESTAALIRFAAETPNAKWRSFAIKAIRCFNDPDLRNKLGAERARLEAEQKPPPPDLMALEVVER